MGNDRSSVEYNIRVELLWAKYEKTTGKFHPLICHLVDVGQTTLALWQNALSDLTREHIATWLNLDSGSAGRLISFWASLHDLGKASPSFQRKVPDVIPRLEVAGYVFPSPSPTPARHGTITTWALKDLLPQLTYISALDASLVAISLGGHHGAWPSPIDLLPAALKYSDKGDLVWDQSRRTIIELMISIFTPPTDVHLPASTLERNGLLTLVSGFVSVADWIGSMSEIFPYESEIPDIYTYASNSKLSALKALEDLGWIGWKPDQHRMSFQEMFSIPPYELQKEAIQVTGSIQLPVLLIVEAPTGIGKTELALYLADQWLQKQNGRGIYIAMPSQATSNQMYERTTKFLSGRYPSQSIHIHLVHGAALLSAKSDFTPPKEIADDDDMSGGAVRAEAWFLPRKRTLLAPFGVGTVDQALLSILQTKHFFVRLFGLGQKVVIFDEVHAYDTYMSTLFQRLLAWLRTINTSVIILSATLSEKTRQELASAWAGSPKVDLPTSDYPRLTMVSASRCTTHALPRPDSRTITLDRAPHESQAIASRLAELSQGDGCIAVICNRVARAQEIYQAMKEQNILSPDQLILFHSRFPYEWREEIEKKVIHLFGKKGDRPNKAIVIATQVIEQSLDLDFDYLISDLAPIDLLLQRAGRLHRHTINDPSRPFQFKEPHLALSFPNTIHTIPEFDKDEFIYDLDILFRTWSLLRKRQQLRIPEETSQLIEAVYGAYLHTEDEPELIQAIRDAQEQTRRDMEQDIAHAKSRLIAKPTDSHLLTDANQDLEEENPLIGEAFRALTRLSEPGVAVVCLYQTPAGLALSNEGEGEPISLTHKPDRVLIRNLLRRVVNIQHRGVVSYMRDQPFPSGWSQVAALRYHSLAVFDEQGRCPLKGSPFTLTLNQETGLTVVKEAK